MPEVAPGNEGRPRDTDHDPVAFAVGSPDGPRSAAVEGVGPAIAGDRARELCQNPEGPPGATVPNRGLVSVPLRRYLAHVVGNTILLYPWAVLALSGLLVLVAVALGVGVEFRASQSELGSDDDPDQQRWRELIREFSGSDAVFAASKPNPARRRTVRDLQIFADGLAERFAKDERVDHVYHRLDLDWFSRHGLYLLPPESLEQWVETIESQADLPEGLLGKLDGVVSFNEQLASRVERGRASGVAPESADSVGRIVDLLRAELELLRSPGPTVDAWTSANWLTALAGGESGLAHDGYLRHTTGRRCSLSSRRNSWTTIWRRPRPGEHPAVPRGRVPGRVPRVPRRVHGAAGVGRRGDGRRPPRHLADLRRRRRPGRRADRCSCFAGVLMPRSCWPPWRSE